VVQADKGSGGFLVSKNNYSDFAFRAEFWVSEDANSGIFTSLHRSNQGADLHGHAERDPHSRQRVGQQNSPGPGSHRNTGLVSSSSAKQRSGHFRLMGGVD
jgi:hypothetical protein